MAKALRTAALVVGGAALIATGVGAVIGSAGIVAGITGATFSTIGTIAGIAGTAMTGIATAMTAPPKGTVGGNAQKFTIDKDSGLPYAMGRTCSGGKVVHRQWYGTKNSLESWVTVHSIGPIKSLGPLLVDKAAVSFSGGNAVGTFHDHMWLTQQLGACPEGSALAGPFGAFPGWGATSKLSGLAADLWTLKFDSKGKKYPNGVPGRERVIEGVYVYDPRHDSTYPGGSGPCRLGVEGTYVYSENPALHAITWAYGRIQNGVLIAGGGLKVRGIDMAPFVEWANLCEANNWKVGGVVYTNADDSWDVLKMIAQAGGAEVMPVGAMLSCTFSAPRVSIGTITSEDICGDVDVPSTASRRVRRNTVIARVRLESHGWEMVPIDAISIPDYVAVDGGKRPREVEFPLVQQVDQGAQLGLYTLLNARELDGIVLPCKVYMIGYRPGDCLTAQLPEASLVNRPVILRNREIDSSAMSVTFTCRSETAGKHPFALGKTGVAPPTPDLSVPESFPVENAAAVQLAIATSFPLGLTVTAGDDGTITIGNHSRRYTDGHPDVTVAGVTLTTALTAGDFRAIGYDDADRLGGAVTYQLFDDDLDARASPAHAGRHYVGYVFIPTVGSPPAGGGGATPPGGACVTTDTPILMADGSTKPAGEIVVGDRLLTRDEARLSDAGGGWGIYPVEAIAIVPDQPLLAATIGGKTLRGTADHLVYVTGGWTRLDDIDGASEAGSGDVVKMTVTRAHTYVSDGILSHNLKPEPDGGLL